MSVESRRKKEEPRKNLERITAKVKWFDGTKLGFGFLVRPNHSDVFLHISDLKKSAIDPDDIREGDLLEFDLLPMPQRGDGKVKAVNIRIISLCAKGQKDHEERSI